MSGTLVLHIPHSSLCVPTEERKAIHLDDTALRAELLRMTDAYTDELFPVTPAEAGRVVFPISRLICDVERFASDADEPMAARRMGAIYTRTSLGQVLRAEPDIAEREALLNRWYWPHHLQLERLVDRVMSRCGVCLIIDCHSFPLRPLPYELDQRPDRPDMCIGTDDFHTPEGLTADVMHRFTAEGFSVAVNRPFRGALVPKRYFRRDQRVRSIMIEVNRALYMDETSGVKNEQFDRVQRLLAKVLGL